MFTVNSLSGGRTSSYMAIHNPADYNVFAVVLTRHEPSAPKDKGLLRECVNRIPNFIASHEDDMTLKVILDLEQMIGSKIHWVSAEFPLDDYINGVTDLPNYRTRSPFLFNSRRRFCTVEQKIRPISHFCKMSGLIEEEPVIMNIGFRYDEPKRVNKWKCKNDFIDIPVSCNIKSQRYKYLNVEWRLSQFPLYRDGITKEDVHSYWADKKMIFPQISNCRFCPFHTDEELVIQSKLHHDNMQWWIDMESETSNTFDKRRLIERINNPKRSHKVLNCSCTD